MVSNAKDDLPEPESPVNTTSLLLGTVTSIFFRLCTRAPRMTMAFSLPFGIAGGVLRKKQTQQVESVPRFVILVKCQREEVGSGDWEVGAALSPILE